MRPPAGDAIRATPGATLSRREPLPRTLRGPTQRRALADDLADDGLPRGGPTTRASGGSACTRAGIGGASRCVGRRPREPAGPLGVPSRQRRSSRTPGRALAVLGDVAERSARDDVAACPSRRRTTNRKSSREEHEKKNRRPLRGRPRLCALFARRGGLRRIRGWGGKPRAGGDPANRRSARGPAAGREGSAAASRRRAVADEASSASFVVGNGRLRN